jgi:hypothetical protein
MQPYSPCRAWFLYVYWHDNIHALKKESMIRKTGYMVGVLLLLLCMLHEDADAQSRRRRKKPTTKEFSIYDIDTLYTAIPLQRQLFHDKIDKEQRRADVSDGKVDGFIDYSDDSNYNNILNKAILTDVNHLQIMIENLPSNGRDPATDHQEKLRLLTAVWEMLRDYNADLKIDIFYYRRLVNNLHDMIIARQENRSMEFVQNNINMQTLNNVKHLFPSASDERAFIYTEMSKREPEIMIKRLSEFADEPAADVAIQGAARVVPQEVYNFASSSNYKLKGAVLRSKDPLVQTIVRVARESGSPLRAMPFLSDIHTGKLTIAEVDKITADPDLFYLNLVRLKIENPELAGNTYTDELKYRGLKYIREMNDLHEEKDPVRFRCIEKFPPEALYFIMVYGQDEVYTSSFLGTYKRMIERMTPRKGNELLDTLHRDRFRTFIRMCAGYNTLNNFLSTMDADKKTALMKDFIAGLEKGKEDDLEDAVDVADAFGSISDTTLSVFLQGEVKKNYENAYNVRSKKGIIIYGLLSTLFEGMKAAENDELVQQQSEMLDLPPINLVQYKNLAGDSGTVVEQFFFYGDEDGKNSYASFLGNFKDGKWKITNGEYWTTIKSVSGKPITVYANLPLAEPQDEEAQAKLAKYMADNNIHPTVIVHRGHSYHLPLTMDRLSKENRIVILGSCGGYHNLATVLDHCPDAHIISSKQVGAMNVNEPIIKAINDQLLAGNNINWISTWRSLNTYFSSRKTLAGLFSDYVPPHKNLGAIFIKAYRKQFHDDEE